MLHQKFGSQGPPKKIIVIKQRIQKNKKIIFWLKALGGDTFIYIQWKTPAFLNINFFEGDRAFISEWCLKHGVIIYLKNKIHPNILDPKHLFQPQTCFNKLTKHFQTKWDLWEQKKAKKKSHFQNFWTWNNTYL